jgi:hypothetical protein
VASGSNGLATDGLGTSGTVLGPFGLSKGHEEKGVPSFGTSD